MGFGATGASRDCAGESAGVVHLCGQGGQGLGGHAPGGKGAVVLSALSCWQHLQEDREGLHATAELLRVRVQSLTHILSMQEEELARKVGPPPQGWV